MAVSPMIPSSLSYSSSSYSSPSTSVSLTNVGTIFLPIQVTKSQQNINKNNNNNNNNTIKYSTNPIIINEGQQGYRYVQNYIDPQKSFVYPHIENRIRSVGIVNKRKTSLIDTSVSYKISIDYIVGSSGTHIRCSSNFFLLDLYILWMIAREQNDNG
jgi:hypothetical protein